MSPALRPSQNLSASVLNAAAACFHTVMPHAGSRDQALRATLDLVTLPVAQRRGLLPQDSPRSRRGKKRASLRTCLCSLPGTHASTYRGLPLTEAAATLSALPTQALTPRLPGDVYEALAELPADDSGPTTRRELREARRVRGMFFTPAPIVLRILSLAMPRRRPQGFICDPAMGTGHFLLALVERAAGPRGQNLAAARRIAATQLYGIDRDPLAVPLAQRALWLALSRRRDWFQPPAGRLVCGDTLLDESPFPCVARAGGFDVIIGNPPYDVLTRFQRRPETRQYAQALRRCGRYTHALRGQINLYRCFIERSLALLRPGGILSFVVPASLLTDAMAAPLRRALICEHKADRFLVFDESAAVFDTVTQAVTVFRSRRNHGSAKRIRVDDARVGLDDLHCLGRDLPVPRATATDWALLRWLNEHTPRRFADVAHGMVGEVDQTLFRRHMKDKRTRTLLARGCHLSPFALDLTPRPSRQRYLDRRGFLAQKGAAADACQRRAAQERVAQLGIRNLETVPRLAAARVPAGVFLGNSLNAWHPRGRVSTRLLLGLLNSRLYDWRFRLTSGNNNINLREINDLPLPTELEAGPVRAVERAVRACERAAECGRDLSQQRDKLDAAVYALFSLPQRFRRYLARKA